MGNTFLSIWTDVLSELDCSFILIDYPVMMTPERYQKYCPALDRKQPDLTALTDQIHKTHNLSAMMGNGVILLLVYPDLQSRPERLNCASFTG